MIITKKVPLKKVIIDDFNVPDDIDIDYDKSTPVAIVEREIDIDGQIDAMNNETLKKYAMRSLIIDERVPMETYIKETFDMVKPTNKTKISKVELQKNLDKSLADEEITQAYHDKMCKKYNL